MTKELQDKLYKKYPKIFAQKDLPVSQTAMCWGMEFGDGWYWLIDNLCSYLQFQTDENNKPQIEASQVKEKFGGLRFYIDMGYEEAFNIISFVQSLSFSVCEECGTTKDVTQNKQGWIRSLCPKCRADRFRKFLQKLPFYSYIKSKIDFYYINKKFKEVKDIANRENNVK
jgi:predicted nucleic acid-binding Zn ribbon protein